MGTVAASFFCTASFPFPGLSFRRDSRACNSFRMKSFGYEVKDV
jgi:hypothetical protein